MLDAWNAPGDNATVSQLNNENVRWENSTEFVYSTDYVRLRNLTIGYNFEMESLAQSINVYTTLTNALTITNAPDFFWDPEFTGVVQSRSANNLGAGGSFKQAPQARQILFGVNIDF